MNRRWTYFFDQGDIEGDPDRKDILGGKGASLAAMCKAGLPVPPGFTLSSECCRLYLDHDGRWPEGLEAEVRDQLARLERGTQRTFGGHPPLLVSVRSGAAVSMPGMMDTILNCGLNPAGAAPDDRNFWRVYGQFVQMFGKTVAGIGMGDFEAAGREIAAEGKHGQHGADPRAEVECYLKLYTLRTDREFPATPWAALAECIEAVFRSWNSERAITYRREHDIRGCHGTAVTVQMMFPSEISGIVFTANPNNSEAGEMVIEAAYGLGEAVVSGDVHPDNFIVDRSSFAIKRRTIGHKAHMVAALGDEVKREADAVTLTDAQLDELAGISMNIEKFFGSPMDIEFGYAGGCFALLQSRPIRGLDILEDIEVGRKEEIYRLRELAGPRRRVWVAHNLGETLPTPTPLTWDIVCAFMSGNGGFGRMYRDLGYCPSEEVCREGFLELIAGRIYADPERAANLFWAGMPLCYDLDAVVRDPKVMDAAPAKFDPTRADARFLASLPGLIRRMIRCSRVMKTARRTAAERFEQEILPPYLDWVAARRRQDLKTLTTAELLVELRTRIRVVLDDFGGESLKPGFFGGIATASLRSSLVQLMGPEDGMHLALTLTQGLEGDTTIAQGIALSEVGRGQRTLESFLETYGHRTVEEMELAKPRWREDASYVRQVAAMYANPGARLPGELHERNAQRQQESEAGLRETLRHWGGSCLYEDIAADLRDAQRLLPYRESGKFYLMMGYETIRLVLVELADRWNLGRDLFFLTLEDLSTFEQRRTELLPVIAARKLRWQSARRLEMSAVIDSEHLEDMGLPKRYEGAREIPGEPIAAGIATGIARIVCDPQKVEDLTTDYVLVCPSTDPGWTALFVHAKALVVERGGVLSHGAIVARDFGIPAVVCPDATRRIPDRTLVRVDGNRGLITLLEGN